MNWKELKEFCNNLPEDKLEKQVILWREEDAIDRIEVMALEEDYYIDKEEHMDGCVSESSIKDDLDDNTDNFDKVYDKGDPILWEKF